jgi:Tol biopolymer transport system component
MELLCKCYAERASWESHLQGATPARVRQNPTVSAKTRLLLTSVTLSVIALPPGLGHAAWSVGKIVFVCDRERDSGQLGHDRIWTANPDGTNAVRLTGGAKTKNAYLPAWSPDGSKIAFTLRTTGRAPTSIYTMNADGTDVTKLPDPHGNDSDPSWSPNGKRIVFVRQRIRRSGRYWPERIWTMSSTGGGFARITRQGYFVHPDWSPDGSEIVMVGIHGGLFGRRGRRGDLYVKNLGTGDVKRITNIATNHEARSPAWSPDGKSIAYSYDTDATGPFWSVIETVPATSGTPTRLTDQRAA